MNVWLRRRDDFPHRAFSCVFSHVTAEPIWHPGCSLTSRPATGGVRGDPFARDCPQNPHRRHACGPVPPGRAAGVRVGADAEQAAPRGGRSSGCALRAGPRARRPGVGAGCAGGVAARGDVRSPSVLDVSTRAPWHRHRRLGRRRRPATAGRARDTSGDARSVTLGRHASPDLRSLSQPAASPARLSTSTTQDSPTGLAHARSPRGAHAPPAGRRMGRGMSRLRGYSRFLAPAALAAVAIASTPGAAYAQGAPAPAINQADTAWMLISTALVLLMTPALAFFYGGLVRSKNALNTMMMSFIALGVRRRRVGARRLLAGVRARQRLRRRPVARLPARRRPRSAGHHPARALHVPTRARSRSSPRR